MKLYQANLSPYTARVRLLVYKKGLDVEILDPPGFRTPEYENINPIGRIPALVLDDGTLIPESDVICDYLEEAHPEQSCMPGDPKDRARVRLLSRIVDLYILTHMFPLFSQLQAEKKDQDIIKQGLAGVDKGLDYIEHFIAGGDTYAAGGMLTRADGALIPALFFATSLLPVLGADDPLKSRPKTKAYWEGIGKDEIGGKILGELQTALKAAMGG